MLEKNKTIILLFYLTVILATNMPFSSSCAEWKWQKPKLPANDLNGVWGSSGTNVFAVGRLGTVLHYNGSDWEEMDVPTYHDLTAVWGNSANSVFAVGKSGTIIRYNGSEWTLMDSGTDFDLEAIWGTSESMFIVGKKDDYVNLESVVLVFNGVAWSSMDLPSILACGRTYELNDIWGSSENNVYAVGGGRSDTFYRHTVILRFDGGTWNQDLVSNKGILQSIWGSGPDRITAIGDDGCRFDYNGTGWENLSSTGTFEGDDIWGLAEDDIFFLYHNLPHDLSQLSRFNGTIFELQRSSDFEILEAVWGAGENDVFAVGQDGVIVHYNGFSWTSMRMDIRFSEFLSDAWGNSANDVYAVGRGLYHFDGNQWEQWTGPCGGGSGVWVSPDNHIFTVGDGICHYDGNSFVLTESPSGSTRGVWGTSSSDVFAVGSNGTALHFDGERWSEMTTNTDVNLLAVWGSSWNSVFAVGEGAILYYNGNPDLEWQVQNLSAAFYGVWGTSSTDVIAVGFNRYHDGVIYHYDGSNWQLVAETICELWDVWGDSPNSYFAVDECDNVIHWDGNNPQRIGRINEGQGIWGSSSHDVFAVGQYGDISHFNGSGWKEIIHPKGGGQSVWGRSADNVYAVTGGFGSVFRYDGSNWIDMDLRGATDFYSLNDIWGVASNSLFVVGDNGVVLWHNGMTWQLLGTGIDEDLESVWAESEDSIWVAGDNGRIMHYASGSWSNIPSYTSSPFYALWGDSDNDVWAVGSSIVRIRNGFASLVPGPPGIDSHLRGIWGCSDSCIYAVGWDSNYNPLLIRWDGNAWSAMPQPDVDSYFLTDVWASSCDDVYVVGYQGNISHFNGNTWSKMESGTHTYLYGIWGSSSNDIFAVGLGAIMHYGRGGNWTDCDEDGDVDGSDLACFINMSDQIQEADIHHFASVFGTINAPLFPNITFVSPEELYPGEEIDIFGTNFGDGENGFVNIAGSTYESSHGRVEWGESKITLRIPFGAKPCDWYTDGGGSYRNRKVWVTVDGVDTEKKTIRVLQPISCQICIDNDDDGYGDPASPSCPNGEERDCNDNDDSIHPGATDVCGDGIDHDCDGSDCVCTDKDLDGYFAESGCGTEVDCNDDDSDINPGAIADGYCPNGVDNNCDGFDYITEGCQFPTENDCKEAGYFACICAEYCQQQDDWYCCAGIQ